MTDNALARRYAQALFSLGGKEGGDARRRHGGCLADMAEMLKVEPLLGQALRSPVVTVSEKKGLLEALLKRLKADGTMRNFCFLLADKDRLGALPAIADSYRLMLDQANGVKRGRVITAVKLSSQRQESLKKELCGKADCQMELAFEVDPEILGGMVLELGDRVMDASLRAQLGILRETLIRGM